MKRKWSEEEKKRGWVGEEGEERKGCGRFFT